MLLLKALCYDNCSMRRVRSLELRPFNGNAACAKASEIDVNVLLREKLMRAPISNANE